MWQTHRVASLPPWLVPLQRRIDEALSRGAWAASCAVYEHDGQLEFVTRTNRDVLATIRFRAPGETAVREWRCSLGGALVLVAGGAEIERISSPDTEAISWVAAALLNTAWKLPAIPVRLEPMARDQWWLAVCQDHRGTSALPLSRVPISAIGGRPLGEALPKLFARTSISGLRARIDAERRVLGDDWAVTVAAAAAEVFNSPEALTGADRGLAMLEWEVSSRGLAETDWTVAASSPPPDSTAPPTDRRARLDAAVQKQAQEDAFGTGLQSPRSGREIVSLDQPVGPSQESPSLAERLPVELGLGRGLEIDDLLAAANLTDRERAVLALLRCGLTQAEIGARLGITTSTAGVHSRNIKKKLRGARSAE